MKLNQKQIDVINSHTLAVFPQEAVIAITPRSAHPLKNIHSDPENHFKVDAREFYKLGAVALVHSHPVITGKNTRIDINGTYIDPRTPSKNDMISQINMDVPFGIVSTDGKEVTAPIWFPDLESDLIGQHYLGGVYDCFRVVRAYYWQKHGLLIADQPRDYDWWNEDPSMYITHYHNRGFHEIQESELREGDGMIIRLGRHEGHAAIYVGDNKILHHMNNKLSGYDSYDKWRRNMTRFLRHKDL